MVNHVNDQLLIRVLKLKTSSWTLQILATLRSGSNFEFWNPLSETDPSSFWVIVVFFSSSSLFSATRLLSYASLFIVIKASLRPFAYHRLQPVLCTPPLIPVQRSWCRALSSVLLVRVGFFFYSWLRMRCYTCVRFGINKCRLFIWSSKCRSFLSSHHSKLEQCPYFDSRMYILVLGLSRMLKPFFLTC